MFVLGIIFSSTFSRRGKYIEYIPYIFATERRENNIFFFRFH